MPIHDNTDPVGLIVPINLVAFCVGEQDCKGERPPVQSFAGATTHYDDLFGNSEATLGINVSIPLTDPPYAPLQQGIHLHWALPDALTRATNNQGSLEFPPVPNRWLVTRLFTPDQSSTPQIKSWVVASDLLFPTPSLSQTCVTLPILSATAHFAYLGRQFPFAEWPPSDLGLSIKERTGKELTAVSNGTASFASYYPDSCSAFGFIDSLDQPDDPKVVGGQPLPLAYIVVGWYDNPQNDPLQSPKTLAEIEKAYQWTFVSTAEGILPQFSRYYGIVQGISWDPTQVYVPPSSLRDIAATVAIGNSPSEVLAAYVRSALHPDTPLFEHLLCSFQKERLFDFIHPQKDSVLKLVSSLQKSEFTMHDAGLIYSIKPVPSKTPTDTSTGQQELIDLPLPLAESLNQLNLLQQKFDFYQARMRTFRSQLFADWYHIFKVNSSLKTSAYQTTYSRYNTWDTLQSECLKIQQARDEQIKEVKSQLDDTLELQQTPALRYMEPTEPVIALAGSELNFPQRYGSDGEHHPQDLLMCRLTTQLMTSISVQGQPISVGRFAHIILPSPNPLPLPQIFNALLQEACLLNVSLGAQISHLPHATLEAALKQFLQRDSQSYYQCLEGQPPSPVMMSYWEGQNPWLPLFVQWSADFIPLHPTICNGSLQNYSAAFFNTHYTIDLSQGGRAEYTPQGSPINLQTATFNTYQGQTLLSPSSSAKFTQQLDAWNCNNPEAPFSSVSKKMQEMPVMVQPLSGFNTALLMRRQTLQTTLRVADSNYKELTDDIAPIIGNLNKHSPDLNSFFNPLRAGYLMASPPSSPDTAPQLKLTIVDVFGKKRKVSFNTLVCASSMISTIQGQVVPSAAYLAPRLTQGSRLLFRWIAAYSDELSEMNSHPATSPVCGWLLPSHLDNPALFLYNQQGRSLGSLYVSGPEGTQKMTWQSAPGDEKTIDQSIEIVLADENPQVRDFALALKNGPVSLFLGLLESMEIGSATLSQTIGSKTNLATLIGAPIALVQASLSLEIKGDPAIYQGIQSYTPTGYEATDLGFTAVEFPVILGGLSEDGLIGYFKQKELFSPYDFSTFYTRAEVQQAGIVNPSQNTLSLTSTPPLDSTQGPDVKKVLLLVDPRGHVDATTGILPTATLQIPPDQCDSALSTLEISFLVAPTLTSFSSQGLERLTLPTPKEGGFQWSWIEENKTGTTSSWLTIPDIAPSSGQAISAYTPQKLTEGWLRLNPVLLEFALFNSITQRPQVNVNDVNSLQLVITNKKQGSILFTPGQLVQEGSKTNTSSIFYLHLGSLVGQKDIEKIALSATNWSFAYFNQAPYGAYWAAVWNAPTPLKLEYKESVTINVTNLFASSEANQACVYFDYYHIKGINDGVYKDNLALQHKSRVRK